jgi:hypothetical protein
LLKGERQQVAIFVQIRAQVAVERRVLAADALGQVGTDLVELGHPAGVAGLGGRREWRVASREWEVRVRRERVASFGRGIRLGQGGDQELVVEPVLRLVRLVGLVGLVGGHHT